MSVATDHRELVDLEEEERSCRSSEDWRGLTRVLRRKARVLTWARDEHEAALAAAGEAEQVALALLDFDGIAWARLWRATAMAGSGRCEEASPVLEEARERFAVTRDVGGLYCASVCRERLQRERDDPVGLWRERLRRAAYAGHRNAYERALLGAARVGRAAFVAGELEIADGLFALVGAPGAPAGPAAAAVLERARIAGLRGDPGRGLELLDRLRTGHPRYDLEVLPAGLFREAAERARLLELAGGDAGAQREYVRSAGPAVVKRLDAGIDAGRHSAEWVAAARWQRERIAECLSGPAVDTGVSRAV